MSVKFLDLQSAVDLIEDNSTLATSGFARIGVPEDLLNTLEKKFLKEGQPKNLTLMFAAAQGDGNSKGLNHLAHEGLIKKVIGGHFNLAPKLGKLMIENRIEGYNIPQGVMCHLFRDIAGGRCGTVTKVGLNTFVDPRIEGGRINSISKDKIVELVNILGEENLIYKYQKIDIALIKGTYSDQNGNISMENEATYSEATVIAQAVKNCGGKVIVQVDKIVENGSLDPGKIKIPSIYVDTVVEALDSEQILENGYDSSLCGKLRVPYIMKKCSVKKMDAKRIIGIRASMELKKDSIVNIGIGTPEVIPEIAVEEGRGDFMTLTVEPGPIGGIPQSGILFGSSINPECIFDQPTQFDFYDGGGIDTAFLGLAECDRLGNINVSKFGSKIPGCGGFINITQNAKEVVFCGTFTVKGLRINMKDGRLVIENEGEKKKFIRDVEQITFSGERARKLAQKVLYITERAVFELKSDGMHLIEIAPGIDVERDVLRLMEFKPIVDESVKIMNFKIN